MTGELIAELTQIAGEKGLLTGDAIGPRYSTDARGPGGAAPVFVMRPASTDELSRMMAACHRARQPITVQGGMTGLVHAARPQSGEAALSLERMNAIAPVDVAGRTLTVEAGVPLQRVQEAAAAAGLLFPLDLGARGSCTIGGNLATNAGGNRVIRYGMTRDLVLGIETVLADGTVLNGLGGFIKNNAGYDLRHLFIGSEGTLGTITRATLRLFPAPQSQVVAFCALPDFAAVTRFLGHMQAGLGGDLSAFEVLWPATYTGIVEDVASVRAPLAPGQGFYVLTELMGSDAARDTERFEAVLAAAFEAGMLSDAVLSKSEAEVTALWDVRDGMAESMGGRENAASFDISLNVADMAGLEAELTRRLLEHADSAEVLIGGHLGDGNLHLTVRGTQGNAPFPPSEIEDVVYGLVGALKGSISAEHGIGIYKRGHLPQSRSPEELAVMRSLKGVLDPHNLLSPGRVFEMT